MLVVSTQNVDFALGVDRSVTWKPECPVLGQFGPRGDTLVPKRTSTHGGHMVFSLVASCRFTLASAHPARTVPLPGSARGEAITPYASISRSSSGRARPLTTTLVRHGHTPFQYSASTG